MKLAKSAVLSLALLLLAACGTPSRFEGPEALRAVGDDILIAVCTDASATELDVSTRQADVADDWLPIWREAGVHNFSAGDTMTLGQTPEGMVTAVLDPAPEIREGTSIKIRLSLLAPGESVIVAWFEPLATIALPTDEWLHPDGSTSMEPCDRTGQH